MPTALWRPPAWASATTPAAVAPGAAWAWGYNSSGQLGTGTLDDSYTALAVSNLPPVVALAGGELHTLAVAGGDSHGGAEIYSPRTGSLTIIPHMLAPRSSHTMTRWPSGQVLATGGCCGQTGYGYASAEVFTPLTTTITAP
jgi:hypothetical protein